MIAATSPAKIHLIGEYSAIFGKPAIVFPINLHLTVNITPSSLRAGTRSNLKRPFQLAIEGAIEKKYHKKISPYLLKIKSNIPIGSGLGSSAALCASLARALFKMLKIKPSSKDIFEAALEGEKVFHGFPSGSDLWAVILEKPILYVKKGPNQIVVKPLPKHKKLNFSLVNSGKPKESTRQMVEMVLKKDKKILDNFAKAQEILTKKLQTAIKSGNNSQIAKIIMEANKNLQALGVVSKKAQRLISKLENAGNAVKITGAGGKEKGSGMLIVFKK